MAIESAKSTLQTASGEMTLHAARPKGESGALPVVIVIQEAFGLNGHIRGVADRFAGEGYASIAPDLYNREGGKAVGYDQLQEAIGMMLRLTDDQVLDDLGRLLKQIRSDKTLDGDRIAITGFCMGGRVSYLAACEFPEIRVSIPFYGGGIAGQQMNADLKPPVLRTAKMRSAMQLHFGGKDAYIPPPVVDEVRRTLEKEEKTFELHVYENAEHGFFCDERGSYHPESAKLAWERTLGFLKKHLAK